LVSAINEVDIQTNFGVVMGAASSITTPVADTPYEITGFASSLSNGVSVNNTTGEVTIPTTGYYRVKGSLIFTCATVSTDYKFQLEVNTTKTIYDVLYISTNANPSQVSVQFERTLSLTAADVLSLYIEASSVGNDFTGVSGELSVHRLT